MLQHAQHIGKLHQEMVLQNPQLKKEYEKGYEKFLGKLRKNPPGDNKPYALLSQKYEYPPEFIDPNTRKPYFLYQYCPIAVYWSVDLIGSFRALFALRKIPEYNKYFWFPKFPSKIWIEVPWASAQARLENLAMESIGYISKTGEEKYYKRIPHLEQRYLTYNWKANSPNGMDTSIRWTARMDVEEAYAKWFKSHKRYLTGESPSLPLTTSTIIRPKYSQRKRKGTEISVMDPSWNLGVTVRALYALSQLILSVFPTGNLDVSQILKNSFYKQYIKQINKALADKGIAQINLKPKFEEVQTSSANVRKNINQLKKLSDVNDGVYAPSLLTFSKMKESDGNTKLNWDKAKKTFGSYLKKPYKNTYFTFTLNKNGEESGLTVPITMKKNQTKQDIWNQYTNTELLKYYLTDLQKPTPSLLDNLTFLIFDDGTVYLPLSTVFTPYTNKSVSTIYDKMIKKYDSLEKKL